MAKSVEDRVKEIIVEQLGVEEEDVTPSAKFIDLSAPCTINEGQSVLVNGLFVAPRRGSPDDPPDSAAPSPVRADGVKVLAVHA